VSHILQILIPLRWRQRCVLVSRLAVCVIFRLDLLGGHLRSGCTWTEFFRTWYCLSVSKHARIPEREPVRVELHVARCGAGVGVGNVRELLHQLIARLPRQRLAEDAGDVRPGRGLRVAVGPRARGQRRAPPRTRAGPGAAPANRTAIGLCLRVARMRLGVGVGAPDRLAVRLGVLGARLGQGVDIRPRP